MSAGVEFMIAFDIERAPKRGESLEIGKILHTNIIP